MSELKSVSIVGCGWLGLPLSERLVSHGFSVKGSTTTPEKLGILAQNGISPFLIDLGNTEISNESGFFQSDVLIISFPPGTRKGTAFEYPLHISSLLKEYRKERAKVILVSSTSVYPDINKEFMEEDVPGNFPAGNEHLLQAEEKVRASGKDWLILRCGGLAGYDRMLARHFAGKKNLSGGNNPVNLVHRDDVINIIEVLIKKNIWNEVFNISAPVHPLKSVFYTRLAEKFNLPVPEFADEGKKNGKDHKHR